MNIKTEYIYPWPPINDNGWCAIDDDTYDGPSSPMGWGATQQEAINDLLAQLDICPKCMADICDHGRCECSEEACPDCRRKRELEREAEREVEFQRNVAGPLLGFREDESQ
jgi:hypothetical protein